VKDELASRDGTSARGDPVLLYAHLRNADARQRHSNRL
jgi:hypothetical protein